MINGISGRQLLGCLAVVLLMLWLSVPLCQAQSGTMGSTGSNVVNESSRLWQALIDQAEGLGLPIRFLRVISPGFITLEFDDLHAFAAEYHPDEHRMVLNQALSFNSAGGTLRPLSKLTNRELGTLYHELFHAYMDYIGSHPDSASDPSGARLLQFAQEQRQCRYQQVSITPILQRKAHTEVRLLTERESWEALNETWAVFVGWAIWTRLELHGTRATPRGGNSRMAWRETWLKRLKKADDDGDLIGYYEPEDPAERAMARKRYLAPSHRITPKEVAILLEVILEDTSQESARSAGVMKRGRSPIVGKAPATSSDSCR
ncbi:MAG: hypothetical protein C4293_05500 [Nitrospiraceae bacterium]